VSVTGLLVAGWLAAPALAQEEAPGVEDEDKDEDEDEWGEGEDDWDDGDTTPASPPPEEGSGRFEALTWSGTLRTMEGVWVERLTTEPLAIARQGGDLTLDFSHAAIRARASVHGEVDPKYLLTDRYDSVLWTYGARLEPRELWVATSFGPLDVSVGRQVVSWGEGLILSPVDVVNARDMRDPGMADLDDVRRPVTMLRLGLFWQSHRLEVLGVPEADFDLLSPPEGPFGLMPGLAEDAEAPTFVDSEELLQQIETDWVHVQPRWALSQVQAFGRWTWRGHGVDLALYGATLLDRQGVIANPEGDTDLLTITELDIPLDHGRYTLLGHSGAWVIQSFVVRWELAAELGRSYNIGDLIMATSSGPKITALSVERDVFTGMLGVTWTGLPQTRIDVEVARGYLPRGRTNLTMPVGETQYAVRISRTFLKERLELGGFAAAIGTRLQYGLLASVLASYEISDGLRATLGYVTYQPGSEVGPLVGMDEHDRLYAQVRWDF